MGMHTDIGSSFSYDLFHHYDMAAGFDMLWLIMEHHGWAMLHFIVKLTFR